ncbi:hypothetical protein [Streptomyces sp. NPDC005438]|uniref:hypothetical protein n=1 Tax=Streptomyces sp. NPDC005438 TaxID=3156880 RepID=UPI0033AFF1B9
MGGGAVRYGFQRALFVPLSLCGAVLALGAPLQDSTVDALALAGFAMLSLWAAAVLPGWLTGARPSGRDPLAALGPAYSSGRSAVAVRALRGTLALASRLVFASVFLCFAVLTGRLGVAALVAPPDLGTLVGVPLGVLVGVPLGLASAALALGGGWQTLVILLGREWSSYGGYREQSVRRVEVRWAPLPQDPRRERERSGTPLGRARTSVAAALCALGALSSLAVVALLLVGHHYAEALAGVATAATLLGGGVAVVRGSG